MDPLTRAKKNAGTKAATYVQNGMAIGLGTGSTAFFFIERLIERHKTEGLKCAVLASSQASAAQALQGGLPLIPPDRVQELDLTVDGADFIDPSRVLVKGGGGALLREKILASCSKKLLIIADETKLVPSLVGCKLPVEILPFAFKATLSKLHLFQPSLRTTPDHQPFLTDNGNYIADLIFPSQEPSHVEETLKAIPGVLETGLFLQRSAQILIGFQDGSTKEDL